MINVTGCFMYMSQVDVTEYTMCVDLYLTMTICTKKCVYLNYKAFNLQVIAWGCISDTMTESSDHQSNGLWKETGFLWLFWRPVVCSVMSTRWEKLDQAESRV